MHIRHLAALALAGAASACAHATRESLAVPADPVVGMTPAEVHADGKAVFDAVCATCHTVNPPANLAPPMSHVARHYRTALDGDENAVAGRVAAWIAGPDSERSLLPAHAIERWGVMPALAVPADQVAAVARYVASLGDDRPGMGNDMGQGRAMMMQPGQQGGMRHGQGMMSQSQGMMMHGQQGGMRHGQGMMSQGQGMMGQGQGTMGQGMMMQHRHGSTAGDTATRAMGPACPMHRMPPDTGSTGTR